MSREDALQRISKSEMSEQFIKQEFEYVAHKLDLTTNKLNKLFNLPIKYFYHYKNKRWIIKLGATVLRTFGFEKATNRPLTKNAIKIDKAGITSFFNFIFLLPP